MSQVAALTPLEIPGHVPTSTDNGDHPMRHATRRAAGLEPGGWNEALRQEVAELFDSLAPGWHTRDTPERHAVVSDALRRGLAPLLDGRAPVTVEVGAGTGVYSAELAGHSDLVLATEIAQEMSRLAPSEPAARMLADAASLPLADHTVDVVAAINAFLFPDEVARVLRPGGVLVWVNVSGPDTPIHLSTSEVLDALPFAVSGVESTAGAGTWCVLRREP